MDDCPFVLEDNPEYSDIQELEALKVFTKEFVTYDTFIWPAFGRGTINNIIYVSNFFDDPFNERTRNLINNRIYEGIRVRSIPELKEVIEFDIVEPFIQNNSLILNLDLDFFNEEDHFNDYSKLKPDNEVIDSLTYLKNLYNWDLITVALLVLGQESRQKKTSLVMQQSCIS
ncbi:hypothetical protein [Risungbinella massiliensis]|uniref:hypothetical protein n=1 Tax=Risungbinella massiliensis TaxID=1329796 RepID=UPI0005CC858A|nr:hypothetical protein [Risungbinella massiliensis]